MINNKSFLQSLSNITQIRIVKPKNIETTSLGAAFLAGLQSGIIKNRADIETICKTNSVTTPKINKKQAKSDIHRWKEIIRTVNNFY